LACCADVFGGFGTVMTGMGVWALAPAVVSRRKANANQTRRRTDLSSTLMNSHSYIFTVAAHYALDEFFNKPDERSAQVYCGNSWT
jgi:hypothetical protein